MSGHNKWSKIKNQKGASDAKKGQMFTKLTREIMVSVHEGGDSIDGNFRLRLAVQKARDSNMPKDNIERAIEKGRGAAEGSSLIEMTLEGYGPSGAAVMAKFLTDNRMRTLQEVRNIFTRHGGNMAEAGSVAYLFDNKGVITVEPDGKNTDDIELAAIDAGADDVKIEDGLVVVYTTRENMEPVRTALAAKNLNITSTELQMIPKATLGVDEKAAVNTLKLMDKLEELDETQNVYSNVDFSDDQLEKYRTMA